MKNFLGLKHKNQFFIIRLILISLNIILLLFNIFIVIKSINTGINDYFDFKLKNVDNFTFFLSKNIYENFYKNDNIDKNKTIKISLNCVDTLKTQFSNELIKFWFKNETNFLFDINEENPDFLIYDIVGRENLNTKYNNSLKIAFYTQNAIPDLNKADFSLGQAHIMYLDRYLKINYFVFVLDKVGKYDINQIRNDAIKNKRKKFCGAVISNKKASTYFRLNFIKELNKYKKVDMGGRAFNNIGKIVKDKINFLSSYKFSLSMENSEGDGYISEKIIDSFIAGTIPIYYGDYMIDEYINPKSFILIKGEKDLKRKIEYIKEIDNDDELYNRLLKENIFNANYQNIIEVDLKEKVQFLKNIFYNGKIKDKRIDNVIL